METIYALKHAWKEGFQRIWLENDSFLVCHGVLINEFPWCLRKIWSRCLHFCKYI